ncbi:MAG: dipeptidase, partial [Tannerella sp.]|nr:dipeptidase [Tannerella sp.]
MLRPPPVIPSLQSASANRKEDFVGEEALIKRVENIHSRAFVVDSHVDTPLFFKYRDMDMGRGGSIMVAPEDIDIEADGDVEFEPAVDIPKMYEGMVDAVCMVAYLPQGERTNEHSQEAVKKTFTIIESIKEQIRKNSDTVAQAVSVNDLVGNKRSNRKSIFIGVENGYAIGKDIGNLERLAGEGVIYITLSHNGDNDICDSAIGNYEHNGLSDFGKLAVRSMNRLGIAVDISHTSEKTSFDVLNVSKLPVIASHSAVKALCDHPRNISDKLMKAIADANGVIQVCLYDRFLKAEGKATVEDAVNHIDYIVRKVGINHVGIGSDFDG